MGAALGSGAAGECRATALPRLGLRTRSQSMLGPLGHSLWFPVPRAKNDCAGIVNNPVAIWWVMRPHSLRSIEQCLCCAISVGKRSRGAGCSVNYHRGRSATDEEEFDSAGRDPAPLLRAIRSRAAARSRAGLSLPADPVHAASPPRGPAPGANGDSHRRLLFLMGRVRPSLSITPSALPFARVPGGSPPPRTVGGHCYRIRICRRRWMGEGKALCGQRCRVGFARDDASVRGFAVMPSIGAGAQVRRVVAPAMCKTPRTGGYFWRSPRTTISWRNGPMRATIRAGRIL